MEIILWLPNGNYFMAFYGGIKSSLADWKAPKRLLKKGSESRILNKKWGIHTAYSK